MLDCYCKTGCGYLVKSLICFQFMTVFPLHLTLYVNSLISAVKEASSSNLRISQSMLFAVCLSYPWPRLRELGVAYCQSFVVLTFLHGSSIFHNTSYAPPPSLSSSSSSSPALSSPPPLSLSPSPSYISAVVFRFIISYETANSLGVEVAQSSQLLDCGLGYLRFVFRYR